MHTLIWCTAVKCSRAFDEIKGVRRQIKGVRRQIKRAPRQIKGVRRQIKRAPRQIKRVRRQIKRARPQFKGRESTNQTCCVTNNGTNAIKRCTIKNCIRYLLSISSPR